LAENIKEGRNWETTQNQFDNIKIGIIENAPGLDDCRVSLKNEEPDYLKLNSLLLRLATANCCRRSSYH
jgi:hypothetical protein